MIDDHHLANVAGVTPYQVRKILQAIRSNTDGMIVERDEGAGKARVIVAGEVGGGSLMFYETEQIRARKHLKARFGGRIHNLNKG